VLPASPFASVAQAEMNWSFLEAIEDFPTLPNFS